jgi:hypothetical protein
VTPPASLRSVHDGRSGRSRCRDVVGTPRRRAGARGAGARRHARENRATPARSESGEGPSRTGFRRALLRGHAAGSPRFPPIWPSRGRTGASSRHGIWATSTASRTPTGPGRTSRWLQANQPEVAAGWRKLDDAFYAYWTPMPHGMRRADSKAIRCERGRRDMLRALARRA